MMPRPLFFGAVLRQTVLAEAGEDASRRKRGEANASLRADSPSGRVCGRRAWSAWKTGVTWHSLK
jgi:hypothetical protein